MTDAESARPGFNLREGISPARGPCGRSGPDLPVCRAAGIEFFRMFRLSGGCFTFRVLNSMALCKFLFSRPDLRLFFADPGLRVFPRPRAAPVGGAAAGLSLTGRPEQFARPAPGFVCRLPLFLLWFSPRPVFAHRSAFRFRLPPAYGVQADPRLSVTPSAAFRRPEHVLPSFPVSSGYHAGFRIARHTAADRGQSRACFPARKHKCRGRGTGKPLRLVSGRRCRGGDPGGSGERAQARRSATEAIFPSSWTAAKWIEF